MEPLEFIKSNIGDYLTPEGVLPDSALQSLRDKLIKLNIKDSSLDLKATYSHLEVWVDPLVATASNPKIDSRHRIWAIDALCITFNRLGGICKIVSLEIEQLGPQDKCTGYRYIHLFRDYFDHAAPALLKSLKDCLTAFIALGNETWGLIKRQDISISLAREVFDDVKIGDFRKGDLYLIEFLNKKKWLPSKSLFAKDLQGGQSSTIINLSPILQTMHNRMVSPAIGRVLSSILRRLESELAEETEKECLGDVWLDHFKEDLAKALLSTEEQIALNTELYVVPGIFHDQKEGFARFIQYLLDTHENSQDFQASMAIVGCLRIGKENGWLTDSCIDVYTRSLGGYDLLLTDHSGFLRSQTLRLMIVSSSTSSPLPSEHLSILRTHLDHLFAESNPQVRDVIYSGFRALLERLVASSYALNKRLCSLEARPGFDASKEVEPIRYQLSQQKTFTKWLLNELLPAQLRPNASYQRAVLALKVYSLWLPQLERDSKESKPGSNLAADVKVSRKRQVEKEHIVLPFDPEVQYSSLLRILVERIVDPYDDIRSFAAGLIKELQKSNEVPWPHILQRSQKMIEDSGRPGQEDGFSRIIEVLHHLSLKDPTITTEICASYDWASSQTTIVDWALELIAIFTLRKRSSVESLRSPVDISALGALALIYQRRDATALFGADGGNEKMLFRVLELAQNIWSREQEILCNESPEGRGAIPGTTPGEDSDDDEDQLNNQGFLSYSWRIVSEASSLLGIVAKYVPQPCNENSRAEQFLKESGKLLIEQLTSVRHRGSLSSIFPALVAVCFQSFVSESSASRALPRLWLDQLLVIVSTSGKLITRRSAGLPMAIAAIVISNTQANPKEKSALNYAFQSLQDIVHEHNYNLQSMSSGDDHLELPQVHALNCIRFLFMDSQLSGAVDPFVASSLSLAFECFKSEIWAVRNCGIMLYTAIVNRIFPKDGSSQSFKSDRFFQQYSGLSQVFLETLSDGFRDLSDHRLIEAVYPALDILSRLSFLEKGESEDTGLSGKFKDLIMQYLGCKIWKIREAAAKSFIAFTPSHAHALKSMKHFLEWNFSSEPRDNNLIHGGLCAAREIYEQRLANTKEDVLQSSVGIIMDTSYMYLQSSEHVSLINQALYIQLANIATSHKPAVLQKQILPFCRTVLLESQGLPPKNFAHSLLRKEIAKLMAFACPDIACGFLSFDDPDYGISLSEGLFKTGKKVDLCKTLGELRALPFVSKTDREKSISTDLDIPDSSQKSFREQTDFTTVFSLLQDILNQHKWEQYRVAATNILLLSSRDERIDLSTLRILATSGPVEPLRESSLILLGHNLYPVLSTDEFKYSVETWIQELFKNVKDEMPFSSRLAALRSLEATSRILARDGENQTIQQDFLRAWIVLHKLLNDDEDEIRMLAAELTTRLLTTDQQQRIKSTTPLQADRRLFEHTIAIGAYKDTKFQQTLLEDVLGLPFENAENIKEQLVTANTPNTLIFKIEKQNLYRDELRCMEYYLELLSKSVPTSGDPDKGRFSEGLKRYVTTGMETLWKIAHENQLSPDEGGVSIDAGKLRSTDGIMGWTTITEEIFVLGMRVANAFRLLARWYSGRDGIAEINGIVRRFLEYGEREDVKVNKTWLDAFRDGMNMAA
ncbi:hypothetical protein ABW20_dc0102623 [Dactylellina cionopaga]|nr:hypothetical protein ABW20_dc0102623 [Dactylellina cionopaga]